ncbi:MAG: hypothetical protein ACJAS9_003039 [Polaribacter sp.]|jgi:hypothetical protein
MWHEFALRCEIPTAKINLAAVDFLSLNFIFADAWSIINGDEVQASQNLQYACDFI